MRICFASMMGDRQSSMGTNVLQAITQRSQSFGTLKFSEPDSKFDFSQRNWGDKFWSVCRQPIDHRLSDGMMFVLPMVIGRQH